MASGDKGLTSTSGPVIDCPTIELNTPCTRIESPSNDHAQSRGIKAREYPHARKCSGQEVNDELPQASFKYEH